MATQPMRSCPSYSSEETRVKKSSTEGSLTAVTSAFVNVLKQVCQEWEVVPDYWQVVQGL